MASLGETGTEQGGSKGKRAKSESNDGQCERKREKIHYAREAVKKPKHKLISDTFSPTHDTVHGQGYQLPALPTLFKLQSSGKRSTTTPCQWMHMKGAVSKPDMTLLQQTAVPLHLVTFLPFS